MSWRRFDGKRLRERALVLGGLGGAAITAPLLDIYGKNPEAFVANRTSPRNIVLFGLLVTVAVPLLCLGLLTLAELVGPKTSQVTFYFLFGLLALGTGLVISRQVSPESTALAIAIAVAIAGLTYQLYRWLGGGMRWFSLALPAVLGIFLFASPTSDLIWNTEPDPGAGATPIASPSSIVFIQLDELPTASLMDGESINEALFPNFARLSKEGTWYRNAFSPSIATTQSVPAALTGLLQDGDLNPTVSDHPRNLFTLLGESYEMQVIEWVAELCPPDTCPEFAGRAPAQFSSLINDAVVVYGHLTLPLGLRDQLPAVDNAWNAFLGEDEATLAGTRIDIPGYPVPEPPLRSSWIDWIQRITNGIARGEPPTLHYAHLKAPHVPWQVNPSGTHYVVPEDSGEVDGVEHRGYWVDDQVRATLGFQRHLYQLGFLDEMLGQTLRRLEETGNWDDTMVVVVADHGASFVAGEHRRWPYDDNRDDLYRIPLFIKYPNQTEGAIRDEAAFVIDILPTIVDALEIDTDWVFDGISLIDPSETDRPHQIIGWCCNRQPVTTNLQTLHDQVKRNQTWVPDQSSWTAVAAAGTVTDLMGEPEESLAAVFTEDLLWELAASDEPAPGVAQTVVFGRIEIPEAVNGDSVLISVDGVIAGSGFILRDSATSGALRAIVAEEYVSQEDPDVAVLIRTAEGNWLAGKPGSIAIAYLDENDQPLAIEPEGSRKVQVDVVRDTGSGWLVEGWSADTKNFKTPDMIYVYAGETLVTYGPPNVDNRNVVAWTGSEELLRSGFSFEISSDDIPDESQRLIVVSRFGDRSVAEASTLG